jgi:hypothetical protein
MDLLLHHEDALGFLHLHVAHGDPGPRRDHLGHVVLGHHRLFGGELQLQLAQPLPQLPLPIAQHRRALVLLLRDRLVLLLDDHLQLLLKLAYRRGEGAPLEPLLGRRLVYEIDRFIGQEVICDIAIGELGRGVERPVGDLHPVVRLVARPQPFEDLHGLLDGGLLD